LSDRAFSARFILNLSFRLLIFRFFFAFTCTCATDSLQGS
jgi:hypothetical protein